MYLIILLALININNVDGLLIKKYQFNHTCPTHLNQASHQIGKCMSSAYCDIEYKLTRLDTANTWFEPLASFSNYEQYTIYHNQMSCYKVKSRLNQLMKIRVSPYDNGLNNCTIGTWPAEKFPFDLNMRVECGVYKSIYESSEGGRYQLDVTVYDNGACQTDEDCLNNYNKKGNCYPTCGFKKCNEHSNTCNDLEYFGCDCSGCYCKEKCYSGTCFSFGDFEKEEENDVDITNENKEISKTSNNDSNILKTLNNKEYIPNNTKDESKANSSSRIKFNFLLLLIIFLFKI